MFVVMIIIGCVDVLLTMLVPEVREKVHILHRAVTWPLLPSLLFKKLKKLEREYTYFSIKSWAAIKLKIVSKKKDLHRWEINLRPSSVTASQL